MLVRQTFKYRLVLTRAQATALRETLDRCRELYNAALQERRAAYRLAGQTLTFAYQSAELPAVKAARPEYHAVFSQTLQGVLHRLDHAYQAFFRRVKAGEKPGFPRFQGQGRYDSFTYPQYGNGAMIQYTGGKWGTLTLTKLGTLKVRMHRPVQGQIKTVTIRRDGDRWFVNFSCLVDVAPLPPTETATGVDLGLLHFATLADGSTLENPRHLRRALKKLKKAQQHLSRCQKGKHRRVRAKREVARLHRKVRNQRADFYHKAARTLVNRYGTVVFEDLKIRNLVQNHSLALSISDAGWGQFVQCCVVKAASAGRQVLFVDPRYTSQTCSGCGAVRKKELSDRWHSCPDCQLELDRDHNAARNILRLGWSQRAHGHVEAAGL
jgi:putative transposase